MGSGEAAVIRKEMTISPGDFRRLLERLGGGRLRECGAACWRIGDVTIRASEMDELTMAALRLPRLAVSIDLSRLPPRHRDDFLRRFDQTFRRGGG